MSNITKVIDLSGVDKQGAFGVDYISSLINPGIYILPFRSTDSINPIKCIKVEVSYVFMDTNGESGLNQIIVVKDGENYQDFYYNGREKCFKILTTPGQNLTDSLKDYINESDIPEYLYEKVSGINRINELIFIETNS